MKHKNHMIISIDAEKAFNKIQHPFMVKTLSKVSIESVHPNVIKATYYKSTASIILKGQKFSLKIGNKTGMSLTTLIQHSTGSPSCNNQARRRNKRHLIWKGRSETVIICR